eukprot:jgi/Ulvmu1/8336/UM042_0042.1
MQFGSRLGGLAGMRPLTSMSHLLNSHTAQAQTLGVVRPLLELTRDDLRSFCVENELDWVEDPSNTDEKYMRTRMRNLLAGASSGALRAQVSRLLHLCTLWRDRNELRAVDLAKAAADPADVLAYWILKRLEDPDTQPVALPCTRVELDVGVLMAAASEASFAVVAAALQAVHGSNHAPHAKDVTRTLRFAFDGETVKRTYHKCYVHRSRADILLIEPQK